MATTEDTPRWWIVPALKDVAAFFRISVPTLYQWRAAGNFGAKGEWDCQKVLEFRLSQLGVMDFGAGARVSERESPALERYREEQAALKKLDRLERQKILIRVDVLQSDLLQVFGFFRRAGEQLQKIYGPEAQDIISEAADEAEKWVSTLSTMVPIAEQPEATNGKPKAPKRKAKKKPA